MNAIFASKVPRGQRINNPLNIRRTKINWQGKAEAQSDPDFETFIDAHHGIRAAAKNLLTYYRRDKLSTVQAIVSRWAPPEDDNDTATYISAVCDRMQVPADKTLNLEDPETLAALLVSMMVQEIGGCPYDGQTVSLAVASAYSGGTEIKPPAYLRPSKIDPDPVPAPGKVQSTAIPQTTSTGERVTPPLVDQPTSATTRKVTAGSIGAMGGLPVAWIAKVVWDRYYPVEPMPVEIAIAIAAAASSAFSYLMAYYTRNRATGAVVPTQE